MKEKVKAQKKRAKKVIVESVDHRSTINNYFDGDIVWTSLTGVFSWFDGKWGHKIELANKLDFWIDFIQSLNLALEDQAYRSEVIPQLVEEIGDMSFAEYDCFPYRNGYIEEPLCLS